MTREQYECSERALLDHERRWLEPDPEPRKREREWYELEDAPPLPPVEMGGEYDPFAGGGGE